MIRPKKRARGGILTGHSRANRHQSARMGDKKRVVNRRLTDSALNPNASISQGFDWDQTCLYIVLMAE